jgi:hypothetical protein
MKKSTFKLNEKSIELMALGIMEYLRENKHHAPAPDDDFNTAFVIIIHGLIEELKSLKKPKSNIVVPFG